MLAHPADLGEEGRGRRCASSPSISVGRCMTAAEYALESAISGVIGPRAVHPLDQDDEATVVHDRDAERLAERHGMRRGRRRRACGLPGTAKVTLAVLLDVGSEACAACGGCGQRMAGRPG